MSWQFQTIVQRFDVGDDPQAWHHIVLPKDVANQVRASGHKRFVIAINGRHSWHCAVNVTYEAEHQQAGDSFCYLSKQNLNDSGCSLGEEVHVELQPDTSPYGMDVHPELEQMLELDGAFRSAFDAMLPGKRRGHLISINKAKTDTTVANRILKLMNELGLVWAVCLMATMALSGCAQWSENPGHVALGNAQMDAYLPILKGQRVAVVGNHTSMVKSVHGSSAHLVDTLLSKGIDIVHVFAPEHGFRGEAANGAEIKDGKDLATGLTVFSLHGKHRKPQREHLENVDVVVFDIQDVGARFYTYISSLMLVMEACAEEEVKLVILDRPNPHGHHMQGPMLDSAFHSFVGFIPVPMVHGLTLGEAAQMGASKKWVNVPEHWKPIIIPCTGWAHGDDYQLGIRPSPNLPTTASIDLYPSLCLFEPTVVSVGRGTNMPFEVLGHPEMEFGSFQFTPTPMPGAAPHPKHEGLTCTGEHLATLSQEWRNREDEGLKEGRPGFSLKPLWNWAQEWGNRHGSLDGFFTSTSFFDKLAGTDEVRLALIKGLSLEELEENWKLQHRDFYAEAEPFLLYPWNAPSPGE